MTFEQYLGERLNAPFVWGQNDCILFAIGWLNIATGKNWLAALPHWSTAKEGLRIVQQIGGLQAEFDKKLSQIPPNLARNGDITLIGRTALLFSGRHIVAPGLQGLVFIDRTKAPCAWSY
ncbi:MAG: hypothetical protein V4718_04545 [Pseudomonadota bacterium]